MTAADAAARTDRGLRRPGNEDAAAAVVHPSGAAVLLLVADGVGGLKDGAYASNLAVDAASDAFRGAESGFVDQVDAALVQVNEQLYERSGGDDSRLSGTTIVALILESDKATVLYAGDSRAYRWRAGAIEPLTRDHSWVVEQVDAGLMSPEEAEYSPQRNVITRCIGVESRIELDRRDAGPVQPGDILLLSTDGLHGVVTDDEMASLLSRAGTAEEACGLLVDRANSAGGPDNIGVAVARIPA